MQRRTLLQVAALAGLRSSFVARLSALAPQPMPAIHTVLVVAKCHLDVGFTRTQAKVVQQYFDTYYPAAIRTAAELRETGRDHYTWTTGSWLLYEYLEQASSSQRRAVEAAISADDLSWHALPFSWQTEMLDNLMIKGALGFSAELDRRFGRKTIGAKMTDVPGHSRSIIAPLAAAGIRLLDIGVNAASTPPDVPDIFLWKDPAGHSLAMLYHQHDYGSVVEIPGSGIAVDVEVRGDNSGPHTVEEIRAIYAKLRARFPGAKIKASTMNEVAAAVDRVRSALPVVTEEIGDTWIYGCASDPYKIARYREVARLRRTWIAQGEFSAGDGTDRNLLRHLLLAVEHTWGTDTKTYLDNDHYRAKDLALVCMTPSYGVMRTSWQEKRDDIDRGVATLPERLRREVTAQFVGLRAIKPASEEMVAHDPTQIFETKHFLLALDPATGSIIRLQSRATGQEWASPQHPLALFTYQTLSAQDYAGFLQRYITIEADWAPRDFGKPGIEAFHAVSREWHPRIVRCWTSSMAGGEQRLLVELAIDDPAAVAAGNVAWPRMIFVEVRMLAEAPELDLRVTTLEKAESRMPEAIWLTFAPENADAKSWSFDKGGQEVAAPDVVRGGGRAMHAVSGSVRVRDKAGRTLEIQSMDAPVVALGQRSPLNFSLEQPDLTDGVHFSLYNNAWGTNYPQWCGGDWVYRFRLSA